MATTPRQFLTKNLAGANRGLLSTSSDSRASATVLTIPAASVTAVTGEFNPEATTTASALTAVPAAGSTWNGTGWQGLLSSTDTYTVPLGGTTVPLSVPFTATATATMTLTTIIYSNTGELGRATTTVNLINGTVTATFTVTLAGGNFFNPNNALEVVHYGAAANPGLSALTITLGYGSTSYVDSFAAQLAAVRTFSEATSTAGAASSVQAISKTALDVSPVSTQLASRVTTQARTDNDVVTTTDLALRSLTAPRLAAEATSTVDTALRTTVASRTSSDVSPAALDTALRSLIKSLTVFDATSQTDSAVRSLTFGRTAAHYFVPTDPPITVPSKHIAGTVRDATGAPFLGGAMVYLVRDSDGLVVASQTSSTVDGSYSFVRDQYDQNTYQVHGSATVNSMPEQDITRAGLVPV